MVRIEMSVATAQRRARVLRRGIILVADLYPRHRQSVWMSELLQAMRDEAELLEAAIDAARLEVAQL